MSIANKEQTSKSLTAMGNPIRIEIVFLVGMQGPLNVGQIADHFKISRPAVSNHLRVLREAQILNAEKMGQEVYYSLNHDFIEETLTVILDMVRSSRTHSCT
jgi:ArsR family transcriptional regulator, arsenate/arsenite/antimonite-responsive transcriptional repressor